MTHKLVVAAIACVLGCTAAVASPLDESGVDFYGFAIELTCAGRIDPALLVTVHGAPTEHNATAEFVPKLSFASESEGRAAEAARVAAGATLRQCVDYPVPDRDPEPFGEHILISALADQRRPQLSPSAPV